MATVTRSSQLAQTGVTGTGEWDSRLNRLLEDLQETVIPTDSRSRNAQEYREYRLTSSSRVNDEPPQTVDEKWVEIGNYVGGGPVTPGSQFHSITDSAYGTTSPSRFPETTSRFPDSAPRFSESKSVAFADETTSRTMTSSSSASHRSPPTIEYLAPANMTTELKSGPSSPTGYSVVPSSSPKVERKEFYSKASYTTMIKGGGGDVVDLPNFTTEEFTQSDYPSLSSGPSTRPPAIQSLSSSSETRKQFMSESTTSRTLNSGGPPPSTGPGIGAPLYSSTPMKPLTNSRSETSYTRETLTDRSVTPPPTKVDALKTPPMIRKILQSSQKDLSSHHHHHTSSSSTTTHTSRDTRDIRDTHTHTSKPPVPVGGVPLPILQNNSMLSSTDTSRTTTTSLLNKPSPIPSYDEPPERMGARYYTSTVTTEHRERDVSPIRRFPSPQPPKGSGEPPKRLDELLATFEDSTYTRSTTYGDGAHKSVPYGPGSHPVQPVRSVRIDDNVTSIRDIDESSELIQRKNVTQYQNPAYNRDKQPDGPLLEPTRNVSGPPVFYPPGQMFTKTEEENNQMDSGKGKAKMKMDKKQKQGEKMKSKHGEKGGEGAVPVPVCLPVCCAAPCVIM